MYTVLRRRSGDLLRGTTDGLHWDAVMVMDCRGRGYFLLGMIMIDIWNLQAHWSLAVRGSESSFWSGGVKDLWWAR